MSSIEDLGIYLTGLNRHAYAYQDTSTLKVYLSLRERMPKVDDDPWIYICKGGEYLHSVVISAYKQFFAQPLDLLPVVAETQDPPIIDLSVPLQAGLVLELPSLSYMVDFPLGDTLTETPRIL